MKTLTIAPDITLKIGQNADENAHLVRISCPHSLWFHLSKFPSPHGILSFPPDTEITEDILHTCAIHVKALSKHKNAQNISMDILPLLYVKNVPTNPGTVSLLKKPRCIHV